MSEEDRIKRRLLLESYYKKDDQQEQNENNQQTKQQQQQQQQNDSSMMTTTNRNNPLDINSAGFDPDSFLNKQIKTRTLNDLMLLENDIVREVRSLDSEMQTLVYENYNKFISATDTIRKMKNDFKKMEDEINKLVDNMDQITVFSDTINSAFKDRRQEMSKLNEVNILLKKLQFLFNLPAKLNEFIENESYCKAVQYFTKARKTLEHYKHMPSFKGIEDDCNTMIVKLKVLLREKLSSLDSSTETLLECVQLLMHLDESADELCDECIERTQKCLDKDLSILESNIKMSQNPIDNQIGMDILEFIDFSCTHFLNNLSSSIVTFNQLFLTNEVKTGTSRTADKFRTYATNKLNEMIELYWKKYCEMIRNRFEVEQTSGENTIIVRAVDRFYRRIQTINKQFTNIDLSNDASSIALYVATVRVKYYLDVLKNHFNECLTDIRQNVAILTNYNTNERKLQGLLDNSHKAITEQIKNVLANLQAFIASDVTFSAKVHFNEPFCKNHVREGLIIPYLKYIASLAKEFSDGSHDPVPSPLLLILTKLCLEFESVTISYLLTLIDEQFFITNKMGITKQKELIEMFHESAKLLLNHYVKVRGSSLSQMIRKSVETRDWLNTIEPRNVRAVMKRIVEDVTGIDIQVGELFEEGVRKDKGSDSSRNTYGLRPARSAGAWSYTPSTADNKLLNNIQKLFAEKIEIFSSVDFSKVSVLTGIIKISLKTFLECIRLKTFSRYGLQQIQVDCYYLQLYLWRFVSDENLVYVLLDEIVTSAIQRCIEPTLMEAKIVEMICDGS